MRFRHIHVENKKVATALLTSTAILLSALFGNCDRMELLKIPETLVDYSSARIAGLVKAPTKARAHSRIIFFVDHSRSMISQNCPDDLDGTTPSLQPDACSPRAGADHVGKRYDVIREWLTMIAERQEPDVQVMIVPFSGGLVDTNRKKLDPQLFKFADLNSAVARATALKFEQEDEKLNPNRALSEKKMGTSVPAHFLAPTRTAIQDEMARLLAAHELHTSLFEFYYVSDGNLAPRRTEIETAMSLAGCPLSCVIDPGVVSCGNQIGSGGLYDLIKPELRKSLTPAEVDQLNRCGGGNALTPILQPDGRFVPSSDICFCLAFGSRIAEYFGRYEDNETAKVLNLMTTLSALPEYFGEGELKIKLIQVTDPGVPVQVDSVALFAEIKKAIPQAELVAFKDMPAAKPSGALPLSKLSYSIDEFYLVNLNSLRNPQGEIVADSDGDGLSDTDEIALGLNPGLTHSGRDGLDICMDRLGVEYGCRQSGCDRHLDQDSDGLNECEEMTIATSNRRRDTSQDGILDSIKVIKGLMPTIDSTSSDLNSDSISDKQALKWGLNPLNTSTNIASSDRIQSGVEFLGYSTAENTGPAQPRYRISADKIPLVRTMAYTEPSPTLSFDRLHLDAIADKDLLLSTPHAANVNQILFVIKARASENRDRVFWLVLKKELLFGASNKLDLDLSEFHELRHPQQDL